MPLTTLAFCIIISIIFGFIVASFYLKSENVNVYQKGRKEGEEERASLKGMVQAKDAKLTELAKERDLERQASDALRAEMEALKSAGGANPQIDDLKAAFQEKTAELLQAEQESNAAMREQMVRQLAELESQLMTAQSARDQARESAAAAEAAKASAEQVVEQIKAQQLETAQTVAEAVTAPTPDADVEARIEQALAAARETADQQLAAIQAERDQLSAERDQLNQDKYQEVVSREASEQALAALNSEFQRLEQAVERAQAQSAEAQQARSTVEAALQEAETRAMTALATPVPVDTTADEETQRRIAALEESLSAAANRQEQAAADAQLLRDENAEWRRLYEEAETKNIEGTKTASFELEDLREKTRQLIESARSSAIDEVTAGRATAAEEIAAAKRAAETQIVDAMLARDQAQEALLQAEAKAAEQTAPATSVGVEELAAMKETLARLESNLGDIAKDRAVAFDTLLGEVVGLGQTVRATVSQPSPWKGISLRRAVDLAGLGERSQPNSEGNVVLVELADGGTLVLDGRLSPEPYLEAAQLTGTERDERMAAHAVALRAHVERLAQAGDLQVAFLPSDLMYAAAVERDATVVEYAAERGVLLATPATLVALLRAVRFGWRREEATQQAKKVAELGRAVCDGVLRYAAQTEELRGGIEAALRLFNRGAASLDSQVLGSVRLLQNALGDGTASETPAPVEFAAAEAPAHSHYNGVSASGIDALQLAVETPEAVPAI